VINLAGCTELHDWQLDLLNSTKILNNLLLTVGIGSGKNAILYEMIARYINLNKCSYAILTLPYNSLCMEKYIELVQIFGDKYPIIHLFGDNFVKTCNRKAIIICTL
jgi:late competence protein required for DNA uptake (superfamily II DNA/RNA helicase)